MDLKILFINDVHGYVEPHQELFYNGQEDYLKNVGGYARMAKYVKKQRKKHDNVLVFDGGDTFHGTLPLLKSKGEALVPVLKEIGFDSMVGHWDFAYGPEQVKHLMKSVGYPMLGINIFNEDGSHFLPPYQIKEIDGLKIGIIGLCCNVIKGMPDHFSKGLKITNGSKELPEVVKKVKEEGTDFIILLSHMGFPQDAHLLSSVAGIDLCLSAHTHNRLYHAAKIKDTLIIQCGCHGIFVGDINLSIEDGNIKDYEYRLVTMDDSIDEDPKVKDMVDYIMKDYRDLQNEIVGHSDKILHRYDTLNSSMDDFLLKSIQSITEAEIAFCNGWRYGAPVQGEITKWDLFNMIPMNPPVSTVDLTGQEIVNMLEKDLESTFSKDPLKQFGGYIKRAIGITVKFRAENSKGSRIHEIYVEKERLDRDKTYPVAFVTTQGVPEGLGKNRKDLQTDAVEAMTRYLKNELSKQSQKAFQMV